MQVEGQRIGTLHAPQQRPQQGRECRRRAESAIHVKPQILRAAEIGEGIKSSIAPEFTVPAFPITQIGNFPAFRSAATAVPQRLQVDAKIVIGLDVP